MLLLLLLLLVVVVVTAVAAAMMMIVAQCACVASSLTLDISQQTVTLLLEVLVTRHFSTFLRHFCDISLAPDERHFFVKTWAVGCELQ